MPVETVDSTRWSVLSAEADPGIYGRADWLEPTCAALGLEPQYIAVNNRGTDALRVALARRRRFGRELLVTPAVAAYSGWAEAFPADLSDERREGRLHDVLGEFIDWAEARADFVRVILPPEANDLRPFLWRGWTVEPRYTYRVTLGDELSLDSMRQSVRRWIRSATDANLQLIRPKGELAVATADMTISPTFARQSERLPVRPDRWHDWLRSLVALPSVQVLGVVDGDEPLASMIVGYDGNRAYELLAGTTPRGMETGAGVYVVWQAFLEARQRVREFDFAGANMESIAKFKRGFGGELVRYNAVSWSRSSFDRWVATGAPRLKSRVTRRFL